MQSCKIIDKKFFHYEEIDSTQSEIWRMYKKNSPSGTVVTADIQTEGKGTHNRKWYTDEAKNIAFSFLLKPNCEIEKLEGITIQFAEIIVKVLQKEYGITLNIKEPNDIVYNNKKIGGILTETKVNSGEVKALVVGVGMNTHQMKFDENIENIATSIKKEFDVDTDDKKLIQILCDEFEKKITERIEN